MPIASYPNGVMGRGDGRLKASDATICSRDVPLGLGGVPNCEISLPNAAIQSSAYTLDFVVRPTGHIQTRDGKADRCITYSLEALRAVKRKISMPAYRERIYICPSASGQPSWIVDFPLWWDRGAFFRKYGDRKIDTGNPFHVDYGLLLTGGEANAWNKRCKEAFAGDPHSHKPHVVEAMGRMESVLSAASWVIVESYEWESGLD